MVDCLCSFSKCFCRLGNAASKWGVIKQLAGNMAMQSDRQWQMMSFGQSIICNFLLYERHILVFSTHILASAFVHRDVHGAALTPADACVDVLSLSAAIVYWSVTGMTLGSNSIFTWLNHHLYLVTRGYRTSSFIVLMKVWIVMSFPLFPVSMLI